jgi:hypothetical protein
VIADVIDLPSMFPHYVMRRLHIARQGILEAHDELDIFGYYLKEGLYIDDLAKNMSNEDGKIGMRLLSYTGQFDEYYAYVAGSRKKRAQKPTQKIPLKLQTVLQRLETSGLPGHVEAAMTILDLCHTARLAFLRGVEKARKISKRERRLSDITLTGEEAGGWGLTYMCGREASALESAVYRYCERKRQQLGYRKWVGIAEVIDHRPKIVSISVSRNHG